MTIYTPTDHEHRMLAALRSVAAEIETATLRRPDAYGVPEGTFEGVTSALGVDMVRTERPAVVIYVDVPEHGIEDLEDRAVRYSVDPDWQWGRAVEPPPPWPMPPFPTAPLSPWVDQPPPGDRLYGVVGTDGYHSTLEKALDAYLRDGGIPGSVLVEEWSCRPTRDHLPTPERVLDEILSWAHECGETTSEGADLFSTADPELQAAAEVLIRAVARKIDWREVDRVVNIISVDAEGKVT